MTDQTNPPHALERMVFFSDAVFAIVITLLVIEIEVPKLGASAGNRAWIEAMIELAPHFAAFLLSFLVIGALWASHHMLFTMVGRYSAQLIWPNLLLLLAVATLPFTSALMATGSLAAIPFAAYACSLLAAGLSKARLVRIALQPDLVKASVPQALVRGELRRRWILPIAGVTTLALAFVVTPWNTLGMLLLPALKRVPWFRS
jgi:uncharacterized membrane protein